MTLIYRAIYGLTLSAALLLSSQAATVSPARAQDKATSPGPGPVLKEGRRDASRERRAGQREARKARREGDKAAREALRDGRRAARQSDRAGAGEARETMKEARKRAKEARTQGRNAAREALRESKQGARETRKVARRKALDLRKEARSEVADERKEKLAERRAKRATRRKLARQARWKKLRRQIHARGSHEVRIGARTRNELGKHARREARLRRIKALAEQQQDDKSMRRVQKMLDRESRRHERRMKKLLARAANHTRPVPAAKPTAAGAAPTEPAENQEAKP